MRDAVHGRNRGGAKVAPDEVWWQGALFRIKARSVRTGGTLGLVEANFYGGMGTPLHVHHAEDEAFYIIDGRIRFKRGAEEFVACAGDFVFGPREIPHCFKVLDRGAKALVLMTPGGLEEMFIEGGVAVTDPRNPPGREYDLEHVTPLSRKYGFDVVGPPLD
jgi:mannose-6-phosphate isomerase-like protein (cupin superfamily)